MSMSAAQSDELRKMAAAMSERGSAIGLDYGIGRELVDAARMMREAADTIESLSDKLQGVMGTRYCELFGTPERAARTISVTAKCFEPATACRNCMYKSYCDTECDYGKLLEWLRGDA